MIIETRWKPTTGTKCPTLFDKWHGIFLMARHSWTGYTKAFDHPVTQTRLDRHRHTKTFDYPVTQTLLDIPRPLITQSHRHGWTYQDLWLPSLTDTAGHTKAFDYPVTQTRLDIPRPLITQSHRHGWTYQGLWSPSHGTQSFDYPHRHGWTYQDLWLPSRTDTAGHTKTFDHPVTAPSPLITHTDTAGHTKTFDYPVIGRQPVFQCSADSTQRPVGPSRPG